MEELWQTTFIALSSKYWKEKNPFLKKTRYWCNDKITFSVLAKGKRIPKTGIGI